MAIKIEIEMEIEDEDEDEEKKDDGNLKPTQVSLLVVRSIRATSHLFALLNQEN